MKANNNDNLLVRIDEAKEWLDKAKTEYIASNPIRGELNLNLAQAEVKYAWELSHQQNVSGSKAIDFNKNKKRKISPRAISVAAAAAVIIIGLLIGSHYQKTLMPNGDQQVVNQEIEPSRGTSESTNLPKEQVGEADLNQKQVSEGVAHQETVSNVKPDQIAVQQDSVSTDSNIKSSKSNQLIVSVDSQKNGRVKPIRKDQKEVAGVKETSEGIERDNLIGTKPQPVPVIQLIIDEEALAKEASRSLRSGK